MIASYCYDSALSPIQKTKNDSRRTPNLPTPGARHWLQQHSPALLGAGLVIAMSLSLAWQTADWIRLLRNSPVTSSDPTLEAVVPASLERLEPLFGPSRAQSDAPPPATNLRLTLLGSFINADPARSSVIIRTEGEKPRRLHSGDELSPGVKLHAVYRDRVEIDRGGRLETLTFPRARLAAPGSPAMEAEPANDAVNDLGGLQEENAAELRERMEALRKQMEESGGLPPDLPPEQPPESE